MTQRHAIERVLVPTDGSEGALSGARRGIDLARAATAELHVLSVVDTRETGVLRTRFDEEGRSRRRCSRPTPKRPSKRSSTLPTARTRPSTSLRRSSAGPCTKRSPSTHRPTISTLSRWGRRAERVSSGCCSEASPNVSSEPSTCRYWQCRRGATPSPGRTAVRKHSPPDRRERGAAVAVDWGISLADSFDAMVHTLFRSTRAASQRRRRRATS